MPSGWRHRRMSNPNGHATSDFLVDADTFSMLVSEDADDVALRVQPSPASLTEAISDAIESP